MRYSCALNFGICQKANAGLCILASWLMATVLYGAQETNAVAPANDVVITNMAQYWVIKGQPEVGNQLHRVRMELLMYYCNTNWSVYWGQSDGVFGFLPFQNLPRSLKIGDRILVDGWSLPVDESFLWNRTTIKTLSESNAIEAVPTAGKLLATNELQGRLVETEALVDSVQMVTAWQLKLSLLTDGFAVDAFVQADTPDEGAALAGKIIEVRGVYSATLDPFGKVSNITLWVPDMNYVKTISSLAEDPRFSIPVVTSESFSPSESPPMVRVKGVVRSQEARRIGHHLGCHRPDSHPGQTTSAAPIRRADRGHRLSLVPRIGPCSAPRAVSPGPQQGGR